MAANNCWSNARLHTRCAALPPGEYFRDRGAFFGSIHATVSHIVAIDEWYLAGLHGERAGRVDYGAVVHATLAELTRAQEAADRRLLAYCDGLTPARLGEVAHWRDDDGDDHAEPVHLVLAHLFVHQIHHRGQVHDLLQQAGAAPPQLDEFFLRADASRRTEELRRLGLADASPPEPPHTPRPG
ncbi:MAG: DinB family protein [Deltaproteobacteria bacterium]|nr:DinB family protein [Deltaproteobacteria bacterium]